MTDLSEILRSIEPRPGPEQVELYIDDWLYIRHIVLPEAGTLVPQHSHAFDHPTVVAMGEIMAWKNGGYLGRFKAPTSVTIEAGAKHTFLTVKPDTHLFCCHNLRGENEVRVLEEHQIVL